MHAPLTDGWNASFGALVIASDPPLVVTHCPLRSVPPGAVNVHGHMHRRRDRRDDPRINVAVEQTGYRPVPASGLIAEAAPPRRRDPEAAPRHQVNNTLPHSDNRHLRPTQPSSVSHTTGVAGTS